MKRAALILAALALAAPQFALAEPGKAPPPHSRRPRTPADPAAVIAAEIAFNRLAQEKGQWTAFRATAAKEAEMFAPLRVKAAQWLKRRADPSVSVRWQANEVWLSCDGSYGVTRGTWQRPGATGTFSTVWQRQAKGGGYKWVLDQSLNSDGSAPNPEAITALVGDCAGIPPAIATAAATGDVRYGSSADGTLAWTSIVQPDGSRSLVVRLWKDGAFREVLNAGWTAPVAR